jgi:hypothetical protein
MSRTFFATSFLSRWQDLSSHSEICQSLFQNVDRMWSYFGLYQAFKGTFATAYSR